MPNNILGKATPYKAKFDFYYRLLKRKTRLNCDKMVSDLMYVYYEKYMQNLEWFYNNRKSKTK